VGIVTNENFLTSKVGQSSKYIVLIDTDIGDDIDDALALALALKSTEIELQGVTTVFGDTQRRAQLAAHLLSIFGRADISIAAGIGTPLQSRHRPSGVPQAAILDERLIASAISNLSGPELIIQTTLAHPGRVNLICIGPLTNIATALKMEPRLFMSIRHIIMMGGSSSIPLADWNVRNDVLAAQIVLGAGIPITMIGFNITMRCQLRTYDIKRLRNSDKPETQLLSKLIAVWQRHRPRGQAELPYLHDPLTITALCQPELFTFEEIPVRAIGHGPFKGFIVPRLMQGPWVNAAVNVQAKEAREWIMQRLLE